MLLLSELHGCEIYWLAAEFNLIFFLCSSQSNCIFGPYCKGNGQILLWLVQLTVFQGSRDGFGEPCPLLCPPDSHCM